MFNIKENTKLKLLLMLKDRQLELLDHQIFCDDQKEKIRDQKNTCGKPPELFAQDKKERIAWMADEWRTTQVKLDEVLNKI